MSDMKTVFIVSVVIPLVCFAMGGFVGWVVAHSEIAYECERLGAFYVGDNVFRCEVKK